MPQHPTRRRIDRGDCREGSTVARSYYPWARRPNMPGWPGWSRGPATPAERGGRLADSRARPYDCTRFVSRRHSKGALLDQPSGWFMWREIAILVPMLMTACGPSTSPGADDGGQLPDAQPADGGDGGVIPLPCTADVGGSTPTTCGQRFLCGPGQDPFRIDCNCYLNTCECSQEGRIYRKVPFDCSSLGCPPQLQPALQSVVVGCGLAQ
jgi:hypothetical protein